MRDDGAVVAQEVIDGVWQELARTPFVALELGGAPSLPDLSFEATAARAALARRLLAMAAEVDDASLTPELALTLDVARHRASMWERAEAWYWLVQDPLGVGFYAMFAPTAYSGAYLLGMLRPLFARHPLGQADEEAAYLALVEDVGHLVDQFHDRTVGQWERGIVMPRAQLDQAVPLMARLRRSMAALVALPDESAQGSALGQRVDRILAGRIEPAFDRLIGLLEDPRYRDAAPGAVGLAQYPGGAQLYRELVVLHTTFDLDPEAVHRIGEKRMARVEEQMQSLLERIGFKGTPHAYLAAVASDPAWRRDSAEELSDFFRRYIERIAPEIPIHFNFRPKAGHDVAALPEAQSGSMTFGFYDPPKPGQPQGLYRFNAQNLAGAPLANVAALNFHELVPGHHFHIASQRENASLHPLRQHSFVNAFNEAWAEYAATFAGEIGMYQAPEEQFGRLMMDAFLTCRLVVDTGMNALGWSLEDGRAYLRSKGFMNEAEVASESVRYSCDLPAQSLAYKLGDDFLVETREVMRKELGPRFDVRDFHDAVLSGGAMPLPMVAANVRRATARLAAG